MQSGSAGKAGCIVLLTILLALGPGLVAVEWLLAEWRVRALLQEPSDLLLLYSAHDAWHGSVADLFVHLFGLGVPAISLAVVIGQKKTCLVWAAGCLVLLFGVLPYLFWMLAFHLTPPPFPSVHEELGLRGTALRYTRVPYYSLAVVERVEFDRDAIGSVEYQTTGARNRISLMDRSGNPLVTMELQATLEQAKFIAKLLEKPLEEIR